MRLRLFVRLPFACLFTLSSILAISAEEGANPAAPEGYTLKADDTISLEVYEEPELATTTKVLKSGEVAFPLIGTVRIGGMSIKGATERIRELYNKDYLVEPKLTLTVVNYAPEFVDVLGAVETPGRVSLPATGDLDLASLLATVGGCTEEADRNAITLVRSSGTVTRYQESTLSATGANRVIVGGGDRVIVGKSAYVGKSFTVLGEVGREGPYPFPLDGRLDLVGAIAAAGGLTELANPKKVVINRNGGQTVINYKELSQSGETFPLKPNDIVTVERRLF